MPVINQQTVEPTNRPGRNGPFADLLTDPANTVSENIPKRDCVATTEGTGTYWMAVFERGRDAGLRTVLRNGY